MSGLRITREQMSWEGPAKPVPTGALRVVDKGPEAVVTSPFGASHSRLSGSKQACPPRQGESREKRQHAVTVAAMDTIGRNYGTQAGRHTPARFPFHVQGSGSHAGKPSDSAAGHR